MTMLSYPLPKTLPAMDTLTCLRLTRGHTPAILSLQSAMLAALPDPCWYYPSPGEVFATCCDRGECFGFFDGEQLAGFGILTPWHIRPTACYAIKIGDAPERTFDFQDVMVSPQYRRRGIHTALLRLFEQIARDADAHSLYCTIAPANLPSVASFTKAGFHCVSVQPAYEVMLRGYYRKSL